MDTVHYSDIGKGVFCMPVIPDFYATHQWLRELKQYKSGNEIIAVYFKIPDGETVFCGKYNGEILKTTAANSHNNFLSLEDKMGFQTIINRKIFPKEITKIKRVPQITGWRHHPKSHAQKRCLCPACIGKGSYNSINVKMKIFNKLFKELQDAKESDGIEGILIDIFGLRIEDKIGAKEEKILLNLFNTSTGSKKNLTLYGLAILYGGHYRDKFKEYCFEKVYNGKSINEIDDLLMYLCAVYGGEIDKKDNILKIKKVFDEIKLEKCADEVIALINRFNEE